MMWCCQAVDLLVRRGAGGRAAATCVPVQSTMTSPGSRRASASSARECGERAFDAPARATVDEVAEGLLDRVQRAEAHDPVGDEAGEVRWDLPAEGDRVLELGDLEHRLVVDVVDRDLAVAHHGVGRDAGRELHHPGPRVPGPLLVEVRLHAVDRLQQRREQQSHRPGADDVDAPGHHRSTPRPRASATSSSSWARRDTAAVGITAEPWNVPGYACSSTDTPASIIRSA